MEAARAARLKRETSEALRFLPQFFSQPVRSLTPIPDWDWPLILILQTALATAAGFACGIFSGSLLGLIGNVILAPLQILILNALLTGCFYIIFEVKLKRKLDPRLLFTNIMIAQIPLVMLRVVTAFNIPIDIIGFAITSVLLVKSLPTNFQLDRAYIVRIMRLTYIAFFVIWLSFFSIRMYREHAFQKKVQVEKLSFQDR